MFDTKPPDNTIRLDVEKRIIEGSRKARQHSEKGNFVDSRLLNEILGAWLDLGSYYEEHEDFTLDIEIIRDYFGFTQRLSAAIKFGKNAEDFQEELEDALAEIDGQLDTIIASVNKRRYPNGW